VSVCIPEDARMTVRGSESPVQIILARSDALALTLEQRRGLELLDIEFRRESVRLSSERQLLELDIERATADSASGFGVTVESLAAVDAITAKLRRAWLRAQEQARATLSADQLAKLPLGANKLPSFESDLVTPVSAALDARVAEAIAGRIKDAKVVEVETAQAIAERLLNWAKSAAIVTGVPVAVLAVVLTVLGISNWVDLKNRIAAGTKEVELQLEAARKSAKEFGAQATALQAQFADLQKQYGDVSTLANNVKGLSEKVERLEQIRFEKSTALIPETQAFVEKLIKEFRAYLQSIGYRPPATDLKVFVDPGVTDNSYYDGERLVVGPKLATMPDAIYREYTQRMLKEIKPESWGVPSWKVTAMISGLADYFPCSYQGDPKFGTKYVEIFRDRLPAQMRKQGYLRNLVNKRPFVSDSGSDAEKELHSAGEVWGGIFWDIRTILGCNSAKCETADKIILDSWAGLNVYDPAVDLGYAKNIVQNVRQSVGPDKEILVRDAFARRRLSLPPS
jgi:hypothetical protein